MMEVTIGKFKIKPYKSGTCWEVWELRPVRNKPEGYDGPEEIWQFTEKYPASFERALLTVYELSLRRSGVCGGLKDALREARQICDEIKRAAKGVSR